MKSKFLVSAFLILLTQQAQALDIEHCPLPQVIKNTNGIYTALTISRKGQWVGTVTAPRPKSSDRFSVDEVKTFDGAVFYTTQQNGIARGVLSRCMYTNRGGERLDLYYRPDVRPELAVKLLDIKNWQLQPVSATGLQTYLCKSKEQGGCVFALIE